MKRLRKHCLMLFAVLVLLSVFLSGCNGGSGGESTTVSVTEIALNHNTLVMTEGSTASLTATISPADATDKSITWASSNPTVASVENGTVTAHSEGVAVIIATTTNGKTVTCTVTVEKLVVPVTDILLDSSSLNLTVGSHTALTATVSPTDATDKSITWTSSDSSVVTVDGGNVTAVSAGTAVITATTSSGKAATCIVTVEKLVVPVTDILLDRASLNLTVGENIVLTATISPADATDKSITWASSNPTVATVDGGKISAHSAGVTVIIATTANGKTAVATVTVNSPTVDVTGVSLDKSELTMTTGNAFMLTASVTPANATEKTISWASSDTSVVAVSGGVLTAVKEGTATVTATTANGKTASCTITVLPPPKASVSVALTQNVTQAGSAIGGGIYEDGSSVTVKAMTNEGYVFLGWFEGAVKVSGIRL